MKIEKIKFSFSHSDRIFIGDALQDFVKDSQDYKHDFEGNNHFESSLGLAPRLWQKIAASHNKNGNEEGSISLRRDEIVLLDIVVKAYGKYFVGGEMLLMKIQPKRLYA